jgi:uncharacterized membrane protein YdjX (TVP38/TMEM64 family)
MPTPEGAPERKKLPVLKLALGAALLVGGAVLVMRGVDVRGAIELSMAFFREAGPAAYFTAFALLPAVGVPASVFTLTAGPVFGERLGMPLVVGLSMAAITLNVMLTWALARRALRPFLEKWLTRFGYRLPQLAVEDMTDVAILVRVTPGSPFVVQNYLLGLGGVPFGKNLLVAFVVQAFYTPAFVLFGDALLHGKGKRAMLAASLFVVAVVATHLVRKHYAKKKAEQE